MKPKTTRHERREQRIALAAGLAVIAFTLGSFMLVGHVRPLEAARLLEAVMPTARFFAFAMLSGSATVLVLMLTLFSVSLGSPSHLRPSHYARIKRLAGVDVIALIGAAFFMLLLIVAVPVNAADVLPPTSVKILYQATIGLTAALGALNVGVMVMLYQTLADIIRELGLREHLGLVDDTER